MRFNRGVKKEKKAIVNPFEDDKELQIKSEIALRNLIKRNLNKEIHPGTKPSMDFIKKILDDAFLSGLSYDAYESGLSYDVSDMRDIITAFAANSSNHAKECLKMIDTLKWCSADKDEEVDYQIQRAKSMMPGYLIDIRDCLSRLAAGSS